MPGVPGNLHCHDSTVLAILLRRLLMFDVLIDQVKVLDMHSGEESLKKVLESG